ncbi:MAG: HAMP domain-containing sensor histidine kinase [Armatimonadota bacterium]|nr:HAMP domain-containing histidine kinase [bacterium]
MDHHACESSLYDPRHVTIADLLNENQVMEVVRAVRMSGKAEAGIFVIGRSGARHIDELYGNTASEYPLEVLAAAKKILETGEPQQNRFAGGGFVVGHPIWLHFEEKSYLKGCFVEAPPEIFESELQPCSAVIKVIADMFSDRMSAAYLSRLALRDYNMLEEKLRVVDNPQASIEERNMFFRSVSHELRTPLTSIIGFAELLLEDTEEPLSERQKALLGRVVGNSHKLLGMVNDLLDLSRLDAGSMPIKWSSVDLSGFLEQIVSNMMPLVKEKNLSLSLDVVEGLPELITDERKLGYVVVNLLSNAIKFTNKGGVRISVVDKGELLSILVSDTGIGIPPEDFDLIFKEFSRGRAAESKNTGSGLGLAIARRLAARLGGEITLESVLGKGSTFSLTLPIMPRSMVELE